jgi:hypothetical protein
MRSYEHTLLQKIAYKITLNGQESNIRYLGHHSPHKNTVSKISEIVGGVKLECVYFLLFTCISSVLTSKLPTATSHSSSAASQTTRSFAHGHDHKLSLWSFSNLLLGTCTRTHTVYIYTHGPMYTLYTDIILHDIFT